MPRSTRKAPLTKRTVIQRINRKLAQNDQALKVARGRLLRLQLGDYYIVNFKTNAVMGKDVDLEILARKLGVLQRRQEIRS